MKKTPYKIVSGGSKSPPNSRELAGWLAKEGQLLFPMVELLEKGEVRQANWCSAAGESPAGRRRSATTSTPSHGPPLARAGVKR